GGCGDRRGGAAAEAALHRRRAPEPEWAAAAGGPGLRLGNAGVVLGERAGRRAGGRDVLQVGELQPVLERGGLRVGVEQRRHPVGEVLGPPQDRKSTRLNSSHVKISYAVF